MPRKGYETLKIIHNELDKVSENQKVREKELDRVIEKEAGLHRETKNRYRKKLKEYDIIEEIEEGVYKVEEKNEEAELSGEKSRFYANIDKKVKERAIELGIPRDQVIETAVIEWLEGREEFFLRQGFNVDEKEAEVMIKLLRQDVYREIFKNEEHKAKSHNTRMEIYKNVYDLEYMTKEDNHFEHLEELRKKTYKLAKTLGYVEESDKVT